MFNLLPAILLFLLQGSLSSEAAGKVFERSGGSVFARELAIACTVWHEQETAKANPANSPQIRVAGAQIIERAQAPVVLNWKRLRHDRAGP